MDIKTKKNVLIKTKANYKLMSNYTRDFKMENKDLENDNGEINYATNKISNESNLISNKAIKKYNEIGREKFFKTKDLINEKISNSIKEEEKIRAVQKKVKEDVKKSKEISNNLKKIIKSILNAIKELFDFIIASSWVIIIFIVMISMISFMMTSVIGIFFSNEFDENTISLRSVMQELNNEFIQRLTTIQNEVPHNEFDITGNRAMWKDIICVFIIKYSDGDFGTELISLDDKKISAFKEVFWNMNEITYTTEEIQEEKQIVDEKGKIKTIIETKIILHITINGKTLDDMKAGFSKKQLAMLDEILNDYYIELWDQLLINSSNGSLNIVEVAMSQIGEVGGEPYWSWYGFSSRVSWCACFVSWCANECGYIENGIIPKFATCEAEGITWFKTCNLWQDNSYIPNEGDIIFFDWEGDGHSDHVGIVERVENGIVYTIEGNTTGDMVKEEKYNIGASVIKGYGTPNY